MLYPAYPSINSVWHFHKDDGRLGFFQCYLLALTKWIEQCVFIKCGWILLCVSEPTIITTQPSTLDITVGESVVLPCQVSHDPSLELKFTWFFNEQLIHFGNHGEFFVKVGGVSSLIIFHTVDPGKPQYYQVRISESCCHVVRTELITLVINSNNFVQFGLFI